MKVITLTSEVSIWVNDSSVTFVTPPSHTVELVIVTSELSIMVIDSTVSFVIKAIQERKL